MSLEEPIVNDWIDILYQAWNKMIKHYARLGEQGGYYHYREEDMRSLLFCKIIDVIKKRKISLLDLHTEVSLAPDQRTDITLGWVDEKHSKLAIEIKTHKDIEEDIDKLKKLIEEGNVEAGACLAIVLRPWDESKPSRKLPLYETEVYRKIEARFKLDHENKGNNNFVKWKHVRREGAVGTPAYWQRDFDAMFLILRAVNP